MITKKELSQSIYLGFWALFFVSLFFSAALILIKLDKIQYIAENFQPDSFDTILSIMWISEYGPLEQIPYHPEGYSMFGNWPLLYAFLAVIINAVLQNPSLSMSVLYWITELAIALLIYKKFLVKLDWKVRLLFIVFFLVDLTFGNLFPLGFRRRQQLAILLGMLMFLTERIRFQLPLAFAALLAQPFTGGCILALKGAELIDKKKFSALGLLLIPVLLSYPFYAGLFTSTQLEPKYAGCQYINQVSFPEMALALLLVISSVYFVNRKKLGLFEVASLSMVAFYFVFVLLFTALRDIAPIAFMDAFLHLSSLPCYMAPFNVAALGLMLSIFLKDMKLPKLSVAIMVLLAVFNLNALSFILLNERTIDDDHSNFLGGLEALNISKVKTHELLIIDYGGETQFKSVSTSFPLQGYSILHRYNITFVEEYMLPYHISKGESNILVAGIPSTILDKDYGKCASHVSSLRSKGIQGLVYIFDEDSSLPENFSQDNLLEVKECGMDVAVQDIQGRTAIVVYRIS